MKPLSNDMLCILGEFSDIAFSSNFRERWGLCLESCQWKEEKIAINQGGSDKLLACAKVKYFTSSQGLMCSTHRTGMS